MAHDRQRAAGAFPPGRAGAGGRSAHSPHAPPGAAGLAADGAGTQQAGMSKQAMGDLVTQCEAWGLVRREPDARDARARRIVFTDTGLLWLEGVPPGRRSGRGRIPGAGGRRGGHRGGPGTGGLRLGIARQIASQGGGSPVNPCSEPARAA